MPEDTTTTETTTTETTDAPAAGEKFETVEDAVQALVKVRQEAADRRTQLQQYQGLDALSKYSESDRAVWNNLASQIMEDPDAGARAMQDIARQLLGEEDNDVKDTVPNNDGTEQEDDSPLTAAKVQELIAAAMGERDTTEKKRKDEEGRQASLVAKGQELGFKQGSPEYVAWLNAAANETNGDLDAAAESVRKWRQGVIDEYVSGRANDRGVPAPDGKAGQASVEKPKSYAEASRLLKEALTRGAQS